LLAPLASAAIHVKGYVRKNGTYVQPYLRSNPDHSKLNNWSTKGNINPYTGKKVSWFTVNWNSRGLAQVKK
jgi:hypothetical protein